MRWLKNARHRHNLQKNKKPRKHKLRGYTYKGQKQDSEQQVGVKLTDNGNKDTRVFKNDKDEEYLGKVFPIQNARKASSVTKKAVKLKL